MPEVKQYTFTHVELAEVLIKQLDIHEGIWGVAIEFNFFATNVPLPPDGKTIMPAGVNVVNKIGLQRFETANNFTVDATKANPPSQHSLKKKP